MIWSTIAGIENGEEQQDLKKKLERLLPKKVQVASTGKISAASIKQARGSTTGSMSTKELQRVEQLESDMKLVKTDLISVKIMQEDMNTRMGKMQASLDGMEERRTDETKLLRALAKKFLAPEEVPPTPSSNRKCHQSPPIPETPDLSEANADDDMDMTDPSRRLSMEVPGTPLAQVGTRKRAQPSPGARLGSNGFLHLPPDSPNNDPWIGLRGKSPSCRR